MTSRRQGILGTVLLFAGLVVFAAAPVMAQPSDPPKDTWVCHDNNAGSVRHWETLVVTAATAADLIAANPSDYITTPSAGCPANPTVSICYPVGSGYEYREVDAASAALAIDYEGATLASTGLCETPATDSGSTDDTDTETETDETDTEAAPEAPTGDVTADDGDQTTGQGDAASEAETDETPAEEPEGDESDEEPADDGGTAEADSTRPGAGDAPQQVEVSPQVQGQPNELARTGVNSAQLALYAAALVLIGAGIVETGRSFGRAR